MPASKREVHNEVYLFHRHSGNDPRSVARSAQAQHLGCFRLFTQHITYASSLRRSSVVPLSTIVPSWTPGMIRESTGIDSSFLPPASDKHTHANAPTSHSQRSPVSSDDQYHGQARVECNWATQPSSPAERTQRDIDRLQIHIIVGGINDCRVAFEIRV